MRSLAITALAACSAPHSAAPDAPAAVDDAALPAPRLFGTHGGYATTGVLLPSRADLDAATAAYYDTWKATYLVPGCAPGQYRVKTSPATDTYTVSEGHGYGMLIAAIIEGHDPDAHTIFDGLYAYFDAHRSQNDSGLMAWAQDQACANVQGADSATDGDLDIAYALLLADRQWGSTGAIDYASEARRTIASILASDVHPANSILVGDWASSTNSHYTGTRPSDFMTDHFRAFAHVAPRGLDVVDHTYALVDHLQTTYAMKTGLVPDFVIDATGSAPQPAPASWLEGADDGHYSYNACRVPWRLATDYLISGEPRARTAVVRIATWIRAKTGGDPAKIRDGYQLDGTTIGSSPELSFLAPFAVGAMLGGDQAWLDALWDALAARPVNEYYGDTIKLLAMIVLSGNWWAPT
jgi:endo-1,4-beta-D-glucanase Y